MQFQFNNFVLFTEQVVQQLADEYIVPTKVEYLKPKDYKKIYKTKTITVLDKVGFLNSTTNKYILVFDNLFDFIDFIEILKAFSNKKLDSKIYKLKKFEATIKQKDNNHYLAVTFTDLDVVYYDKFESLALASKFQKIISRCEAWNNSDEMQDDYYG
jgi:mRNA-degrading endonuclease HigB of HigAB toxin-antitoxin module